MKNLVDAAFAAGRDPAGVLFALGAVTQTVEEVWPDAEEGLVETAVQLVSVESGQGAMRRPHVEGGDEQEKAIRQRSGLPAECLYVLRQLQRHKHFGSNVAALDQIKRHYCKAAQHVERAVEGLEKAGLLARKRGGAVSLIAGERARIEELLRGCSE